VSIWRHFSLGLRALKGRTRPHDEIDEEVRDFFERARADLVRQGMSPAEAARAVRLELGDAFRAGEDVRQYGWENVAESIFVDLKHALRRLRQAPTFALVAILTLAVGIGTSTAIFSAVSPILLEPLPYPNADRIVMLTDRTDDGAPLDTTYGTFVEVGARGNAFDELAVAQRWNPALSGSGEPEYLIGDRVSADYFRLLGVALAAGRDFVPEDQVIGGPQIAVVTDAFAKRRFGDARGALEQGIRLDGVLHTVIGVLPPNFANVLTPGADVWSSLQFRNEAPFQSGEWGHQLRMIGRLREGVSAESAQQQISFIANNPIEDFPRPEWAALRNGLSMQSLQGSVTAGARAVLIAVSGSVVLLLVLACANVTNLLLARGVARRSELAVRAVLGAGRSRIVRQLLTESLLLAAIGGAVGLGLAFVGVRVIVALAPPDLPRVDAIHVDWWAFYFAFAVTAVIGIVVGLAPALRGARAGKPDLNVGARAAGGLPVVRNGLVVVEVALALMLLIGAGLLLRSVERLYDATPGFEGRNLLTMQVVATSYGVEQRIDGYRRRSAAEVQALFESMLDAVRALPGVRDAAFTTQLPLSGDRETWGVRFESDADVSPYRTGGALRYGVTPDYFRAMGIPLLEGRVLDAQDRPGTPEAVLLSESFAKRRFGDRSPIGQRLRIGPEISAADRDWDVVVGVVGDVKQDSMEALTPPDAVYVAAAQWMGIDLVRSLVVRTDGDAAALVPAVRQAIASASSIPAITRVATMDELMAASEAERHFALTVFGMFAAAALVLAALGLYGVIAGRVAGRTREIGLRSALGATPQQILALVLRQGMMLAVIGVAIGIAGAAAATQGLESLLYEVTSLDPLTYATVIALMAAVAAAASWLPAARASRVDPTIALRAE
jgi:putative ABC transport system permease protein